MTRQIHPIPRSDLVRHARRLLIAGAGIAAAAVFMPWAIADDSGELPQSQYSVPISIKTPDMTPGQTARTASAPQPKTIGQWLADKGCSTVFGQTPTAPDGILGKQLCEQTLGGVPDPSLPSVKIAGVSGPDQADINFKLGAEAGKLFGFGVSKSTDGSGITGEVTILGKKFEGKTGEEVPKTTGGSLPGIPAGPGQVILGGGVTADGKVQTSIGYGYKVGFGETPVGDVGAEASVNAVLKWKLKYENANPVPYDPVEGQKKLKQMQDEIRIKNMSMDEKFAELSKLLTGDDGSSDNAKLGFDENAPKGANLQGDTTQAAPQTPPPSLADQLVPPASTPPSDDASTPQPPVTIGMDDNAPPSDAGSTDDWMKYTYNPPAGVQDPIPHSRPRLRPPSNPAISGPGTGPSAPAKTNSDLQQFLYNKPGQGTAPGGCGKSDTSSLYFDENAPKNPLAGKPNVSIGYDDKAKAQKAAPQGTTYKYDTSPNGGQTGGKYGYNESAQKTPASSASNSNTGKAQLSAIAPKNPAGSSYNPKLTMSDGPKPTVNVPQSAPRIPPQTAPALGQRPQTAGFTPSRD
jgi:hypothetical protein